MKDEILAYLHDILNASRSVKQFVGARTYDDRIVWGVIEEDLDPLIEDIARLME